MYRKNAYRKSVLSTAIVATLMIGGPAFAQSITGGVYGNAPAGKNVVAEVTNPATGYDSKVQADANGRFAITGLRPGDYVVKLLRDGQVVDQRGVSVSAGSSSPVIFTAAAGNNVTNLNSVTVTANRPTVNAIDVTTSQQVQTWTSADVNRLPLVNADLINVGAMQSNVAYIQSSHGVAPQFNGASGTENRYFVNEFNMTDMQQGSVPDRIPNEAFQSISTIDGGMDAKYGSAMGGVISGTIKQGTNDFKGGVTVQYTPSTGVLNENPSNTYNLNGQIVHNNQGNHWSPGIMQDYWASGPIVKDKLFFYALAELEPNNYGQGVQGSNPTTTVDSGNKNLNTNRDHQFLVNLTWNIAPGHTLNIFGDRQIATQAQSQYALATPYDASSAAPALTNWGGNAWHDKMLVANYHGQITDTFSVTAMAGTSQQYFSSYNQYGINVPNLTYKNPDTGQTTSPANNGAGNEYYMKYRMMGSRIDFTWDVTDNHEITFGGEEYSPTMAQANIPNPNKYTFSYCSTALGPTEPCLINGQSINPTTGQPFAPGTKYVSLNYDPRIFYNSSPTWGYYLADSWHFADNWTAYFGGRYDRYTMTDNANIQMYSKGNFTPRVGVAWDVHGDSSLKIGATAGEYSEGIPLYFNAYGGTPGQGYIHTNTTYIYTGVAADGVPTGLTQVGTVQGSNGSGLHYLTADQFISRTTQNAKLRNFSVYAQQKLGDSWTAGATLFTSELTGLPNIYNNINQLSTYLAAHGYPNASFLGQYLITPGKDITIPVQLNGTNSPLSMYTFPASYIGYPTLKRRIYQASLTLDHAYSDAEPYYLSASYTWRHDYGNTDGTTDYVGGGNNLGGTGYDGQLSSSAFLQGASGNLGNDIPSTFKVFGYYKFTHYGEFLKGLRVGGALTYYAGGPIDCLSNYPYPNSTDINPGSTGNTNAFYCNTLANARAGNPISNTILYPRGSYGTLPSYKQVDLDIGYDWAIDKNSFSLDLKVLNLFNSQTVTSYDTHITQGNGQYNATFMTPNSFQAPRMGELVFRWQFN